MPAEGRHDTTEPRTRPLALFALALVASIAVAGVLSDRLLSWLDFTPSPAAPATQPAPPRLDPDPASSLAALRAREDERLGGYAWVDASQQLARVPIERAMELLVEGGR